MCGCTNSHGENIGPTKPEGTLCLSGLRRCGLVTATVHYFNSPKVKLLLIYSPASLASLTGMSWGSVTPMLSPSPVVEIWSL